ncbi:MAG: hypothetical protein ACI4QR_06330 [Eubacteriales bacterium]
MKKVIALLLVMVMAMGMVVACGNNNTDPTTAPSTTTAAPDKTDGTTKAPDATTEGTKATTPTTAGTTEPPKPVEGEAVVYLPMTVTDDTVAFNVTNGTPAGKITSDKELVGGHFYLIKTPDNTVIADLGVVIEDTNVDRWGFVYTGASGTWYKTQDNYNYNMVKINPNNINPILTKNSEIGKFGTIIITGFTSDMIFATVDGVEDEDITDYKFNFVYFDYEGNTLNLATENNKEKTMYANQLKMLIAAEDLAYDGEIGSTSKLWNAWMAKYGKVAAEEHMPLLTAFKASLSVFSYKSAVNAMNKAIEEGKSDSELEPLQENLDYYTDMYKDFLKYYNEVQNNIFWTSDVENSSLFQTSLGADTQTCPAFQYYYDAATDTYTVFVSSFGYVPAAE